MTTPVHIAWGQAMTKTATMRSTAVNVLPTPDVNAVDADSPLTYSWTQTGIAGFQSGVIGSAATPPP